ncbi:uncharacterized protein T069G_10882 [Trichoderma breve]|uniref:BZIP domain-containing protein n=1 Tax=Trichoderma breve TaxID=2034170 RepID=A0A9W9B655_9HYPO|nr:uncharacterized protein T069G_10882 [Trichoderma breve]KAJ4855324.1 hypothetical protein T069G_10882 [Trichoderma breve]
MAPSSRTHTRASGKARSIPDPDADLTANEIRLARRKIQNRLNQRAHRSRARDRRVDGTGQPYRVHRWRIDDGKDDIPYIKPREFPSDSTCVPVKDKSAPSNQLVVSKHPEPSRTSAPWLDLSYCLLSDHLLHLIHFNVLRGLSYNKKVIKPNAFIECTGSATAQLKKILPHIPEATSLVQIRLPESLAPTKLQMSCPHSNWIDVFPFPKMRDNLIRWENYFSHAEFLTDLLGNLISCMTAPPPKTTHSLLGNRAQGDDEDVPTDRRGLILWGEPFHKDSWEVTPGFLRKWSWAVDGCGELLESTNRWRRTRGETPLRMAVMSQ